MNQNKNLTEFGNGTNVDGGLKKEIPTENTAKKSEVTNEKKERDNVVYVGSKPLVNYIRSIIAQFNRQNSSEVLIRSRGKFISKAVDIAEVSKRSLQEIGVNVKSIGIASESFEKDGKTTNVSTMEIVLFRK